MWSVVCAASSLCLLCASVLLLSAVLLAVGNGFPAASSQSSPAALLLQVQATSRTYSTILVCQVVT